MKVRTFKIGGIHPEENKLSHESATSQNTPDDPTDAVDPVTAENPNLADFVDYVDQNWDINDYYVSKGVESDATIRGDLWIVNVPDVFTTEMPKAD